MQGPWGRNVLGVSVKRPGGKRGRLGCREVDMTSVTVLLDPDMTSQQAPQSCLISPRQLPAQHLGDHDKACHPVTTPALNPLDSFLALSGRELKPCHQPPWPRAAAQAARCTTPGRALRSGSGWYLPPGANLAPDSSSTTRGDAGGMAFPFLKGFGVAGKSMEFTAH